MKTAKFPTLIKVTFLRIKSMSHNYELVLPVPEPGRLFFSNKSRVLISCRGFRLFISSSLNNDSDNPDI